MDLADNRSLPLARTDGIQATLAPAMWDMEVAVLIARGCRKISWAAPHQRTHPEAKSDKVVMGCSLG